MNTHYYPNQVEQTNFQSFDLINEAMKRKGIYLLEYHDTYLKDAFVTQLAEQFVNRGSNALFIQEETIPYSLSDIFLSRTLFKQNPNNYPSPSQIKQDSVALLNPPFIDQFKDSEQKTSFLSVKSKHPTDFLQPMFQALDENPQIQNLIIDSHTDYFFKMNLYPPFNENLTILFTSQISSEESSQLYSSGNASSLYFSSSSNSSSDNLSKCSPKMSPKPTSFFIAISQ
jgi:hypothetical protein